MFAPWCPTCAARILLGPGRIEQMDRGPAGPRVVLRCFCGTLLVWSAASDRKTDRVAAGDHPAPSRDLVASAAAPAGRARAMAAPMAR